jgi:hypothetical protein
LALLTLNLLATFVVVIPQIKSAFQWRSQNQNEDGKNSGCPDKRPSAETAGHANARGQPDGSSRCKAVNLFSGRVPKNHTGSQKANAGNYALDDAAASGRIGPAWMLADEHHESGPESNDAHGSNTGGFAAQLAIHTNCSAYYSGGS